jgi:hypothetical protein
MGHPDNKRLGFIEGGRFETLEEDGRDATIAFVKMPEGYALQKKHVIILDVEEWDDLKEADA